MQILRTASASNLSTTRSLLNASLATISKLVIPVLGLSGLGLSLTSCGSDVLDPFIDASWRLSRDTGLGYDPRTIQGVNGQNGLRITCELGNANGRRTLNLRSYSLNTYGFNIQNAEFMAGGSVPADLLASDMPVGQEVFFGSPVSDRCNFIITDTDNSYEGRCGGAEFSAAQPCKITNVRMYQEQAPPVASGEVTLRGEVQCQNIPVSGNPALSVNVGATSTAPRPFAFRALSCRGASL